MAITKKSQSFEEALSRVRGVLDQVVFHGKVYPEVFLDESTSQDFDDAGLRSATGLSLDSDEIKGLDENRLSPHTPPPDWLKAEDLLREIQQAIADASGDREGIVMNAAEGAALSLQIQFLSDLRRVMARRSASRLQRLTHAAHRRHVLASGYGQLQALSDLIDTTIARASEKKR
ncbi:MAG: hypothetical protein KatS3mg109_0017 [Pirellulaceae bacterium]|nr:MAG: hypothetical protein KatS3mg109_0017 [Pirellulaceae bacterium]